jgi:glutamate racemase
MNRTNPIGIIDSGIGGLSILPALARSLPNEAVCYLGDNARFPYGSKSKHTLRDYSLELSSILAAKGVKAIVVACGTLSSYTLADISKETCLPVFGVVKPTCRVADSLPQPAKLVVWATPATIDSEAYQSHLKSKVKYQACPSLASSVEQDTAAKVPINDGSRVVLGCTHYSWLDVKGSKLSGNHELAREVKLRLWDEGLLNKSGGAKSVFYFTGDLAKPKLLLNRMFTSPIIRKLNIKEELNVPSIGKARRH